MAAASFSGLDKDKDGYLSRQEADAQGGLTQRWQSMDRNGDDRIDRAEFSAFEAAGPAEAPKTEPTKPKPTEGGAMPKPAEGGAMPKQGGGAGAY
jgi:Ca2+-binding EF-hand superfamily protein